MIQLVYLAGETLHVSAYQDSVPFDDLAAGIDVSAFDGILLCDSFLTSKRHQIVFFNRAVFSYLRALQHFAGRRYLFVLGPGGRFTADWFGELGVFMSRCFTHPVDFIWVVMGNDVYSHPDKVDVSHVCSKGIGYLRHVQQHCLRQLVVFGGSSGIWRYGLSIGSDFAAAYDAAVDGVLSGLRQAGFECISGADLLDGIQLVDRIGHVDWSDASTVFIIGRFLLFLVFRLQVGGAVSKL